MTAKLIALWTKADDHEAFEEDYKSTHVPLVGKVEGLRGASFGTVLGGTPYARVAVLEFDSPEQLMGALGTDHGTALATDGQRLQEKHGNRLDALIVVED